MNQLLSITHGISALFDEEYDVWGVFLDISKALVWYIKVWYKGLIFLANCYVSNKGRPSRSSLRINTWTFIFLKFIFMIYPVT